MKRLVFGTLLAIAPLCADTIVIQNATVMTEGPKGIFKGSVVIKGSELVGIMSERDYARKVILKDRSSRDTPVADIMTASVITVATDATVDECMRLCTNGRLRHLPVLDGGRVVGVVSIGDLVKATIDEQKETINQLEAYITS